MKAILFSAMIFANLSPALLPGIPSNWNHLRFRAHPNSETGTESENFPPPIHEAAAAYDDYLGVYDLGNGTTFTLTYKDQQLLGNLSGVGTIELFPEKEKKDAFYAKTAPAKFTFERDKNGKVNSLTIVIERKGTMNGNKIQ
ncbi:DUF3471 domain-containing protein [Persicitalea sp.]|uniref:DUF3471 domain-containing protein n=1 Tax=Persicitalea sp. TaxID=3100273 RepID=UPI003592FF8D